MKLRNYLELMGFRQKPRHYGYTNKTFDLRAGRVNYAQWQHPRESDKEVTDAMVDAYREHIRPGDFCIDIGAHTGDSTLPMAIAATASGCVVAMEPNPFVYHVLERNARTNKDIANIRPIMAAVAPQPGFVTFEYSDAGFCNGGNHKDIPATKHGHPYALEVYCIDLVKELKECYADELSRLRFIKTDTEGFDLYVLQSLESLLAEYHPVIKAEVFKDTDARYRLELLSLLEGLGYSVYKIIEEPIAPGPKIDENNVEESRHYDILAVVESS